MRPCQNSYSKTQFSVKLSYLQEVVGKVYVSNTLVYTYYVLVEGLLGKRVELRTEYAL